MLSNKQWLAVGVLVLIALFAYDQTRQKKDPNAAPADSTVKLDTLESASWKPFRPQSGKFEVLFPSPPQHVSEVHPNGNMKVKYEVYAAQARGGSTFIITAMSYPPTYDIANPDEFLEGIMKDMLGAKPQNELVDSAKDSFQGHPSLDFKIKNSDFTIKSKAILAGKTVFVLTAMERQPGNLDADFAKFTGSFVPKVQEEPASEQSTK